jgi:hypothetical protein
VIATASVSLPVFFRRADPDLRLHYHLGWAPPPNSAGLTSSSARRRRSPVYLIDSLIAGDLRFVAALKQLILP